jgi:phenylacetate-CoA ligase
MSDTPTFQHRIYEMLMESQYWPPARILEFQTTQLAQLLKHAKATVPFYQTRLDCIFKGNGDIDWNRWQEIPIVSRIDLRDSRDTMLTSSLPDGHGPTKDFSTSGSSGIPITITSTAITTTTKTAALRRMCHTHSIDDTKNSATFVFPHELEGTIHKSGDTPIWSCRQSANGTKNIKINLFIPDDDKLDILAREQVSYLSHLPNTAEILGYRNQGRRTPVKLDAFLGYGQSIGDEQRQKIHAAFGARCISIYSSKEAGLMACQCATGTHFHINSELVFLEIINERNEPCAPGETGRVVVTPLHSTAQPLIRYEQGDLATRGHACGCGVTLPVIKSIEGRQDPIFIFPDRLGSEVLIDKVLLQKSLSAHAIQVAQVKTLDFEIRFVSDADAPARAKSKIVRHLREVLHPNLNVTYVRVTEIPRNAGGKQQRFVREFQG